CLQRSDWWTF
nr:immunoglobulin light chain junction region [Macaca mulatta]